MNTIQIVFFILLGVFYIAYFIKMILLKMQGVTGNLLGKGEKPKSAIKVELYLRTVTLAGAIVQFISVIFQNLIWSIPVSTSVQNIGGILALIGNIFFIVAIVNMKNNWRAGFDQRQNTELITNGIYSFSRNPAFIGFYFIYVGCALAFSNVINIAITVFTITLFHKQILSEEDYLEDKFGNDYVQYKLKVRRYF